MCTICREDNNENIIIIDTCNHKFHKDCIIKVQGGICPNCRGNLYADNEFVGNPLFNPDTKLGRDNIHRSNLSLVSDIPINLPNYKKYWEEIIEYVDEENLNSKIIRILKFNLTNLQEINPEDIDLNSFLVFTRMNFRLISFKNILKKDRKKFSKILKFIQNKIHIKKISMINETTQDEHDKIIYDLNLSKPKKIIMSDFLKF